MKKVFAGVMLFSIALGFVTGSALVPSEQANAALLAQCLLEPAPFDVFWPDPNDEECPDVVRLIPVPDPMIKYVLDTTVYVPLYQCAGYWSNTGKPCQCVFVECLNADYIRHSGHANTALK